MKARFIEKGFPERKIFQTCDWADLQFIRPLPQHNAFSKKNRLTGRFIVLYAGNFGRIHNWEDLLEAAEKSRDQKEILFVCVGEGALEEWLKEKARIKKLSNILFLPFEPRSHLPEVLAAADLSLILLKKGMEGLSVPSKIYSILASGRPILACVGETSEIARLVRESASGIVIPPGNPEALAQAVRRLFENPSLCRDWGGNARRYSESMDFKQKAFKDYEQVIREELECL